jgi:hypothetical protein
MVRNCSILVRQGLFLIISGLVMVGQVVAQDRGEADFVCLDTQINPDNDTPEFGFAASDSDVVWSGYAENKVRNIEIFVKNLETEKVTQISNNDGEDIEPQIHGEYVVWQFRNRDSRQWDIALHNLIEGTTKILGFRHSDDVQPMIEGSYVVWSDVTNGILRYYNITDDTVHTLEDGLRRERYQAYAINNGRILYEGIERENTIPINYALYVYDIESKTTKHVSADLPLTDGKYYARMSGDLVVWENRAVATDDSSTEIYAYNIATDVLTRVTNDNDRDIAPQMLRGEYLAYLSKTETTDEMRLYNLQSGVDTLLQSAAQPAYNPPYIEDNMVAWASIDGIYVYHIDTARSFKVTDEEEVHNIVVLHNNDIFWRGRDEGSQEDDIFMTECEFGMRS